MTEHRVAVDVSLYEIEDEAAFRTRVDAALAANVWDTLDDEHRKALAMLVRDVNLTLLDEPPEQWIPKTLIATSGDSIAMVFHVRFDQLEERVLQMRMQAERAHANRRTNLEAMIEELRSD